MTENYAETKRVLYHLDGSMAFFHTTANVYFQMSGINLTWLNRNRNDGSLPNPPSQSNHFTIYFPTLMWLQGIFLGFDELYYVQGGGSAVSVSPNTTGLDDGDWYSLGIVPIKHDTLWQFHQDIQILRGEHTLNVRAIRFSNVPTTFDRIHLWGIPVEPTPVYGDLLLVRDDGMPLSVDDLWLGDMIVGKQADFNAPMPPPSLSQEVSFRVKNASTRYARGVKVDVGYLQPNDNNYNAPIKEVKVNSGPWIGTDNQSTYTVAVDDLAPGATSTTLITYRLSKAPDPYYSAGQMAYQFPIILRPYAQEWWASQTSGVVTVSSNVALTTELMQRHRIFGTQTQIRSTTSGAVT